MIMFKEFSRVLQKQTQSMPVSLPNLLRLPEFPNQLGLGVKGRMELGKTAQSQLQLATTTWLLQTIIQLCHGLKILKLKFPMVILGSKDSKVLNGLMLKLMSCATHSLKRTTLLRKLKTAECTSNNQ